MEYKVVIDGTEYGFSDIQSGNIERPLYDDFSIGNACEAMLKTVILPKSDIPRNAECVAYSVEDDVWTQLGVFWIDERETDYASGLLTIIAYDAMMKADTVWTPDDDLEFPMSMPDAVDVIAGLMGVTVDSRTALNADYTIDYPANDYTLRNILQFIAAAHGGNWIITAEGELLLVPLLAGTDTDLLVTEDEEVITLGDDDTGIIV